MRPARTRLGALVVVPLLAGLLGLAGCGGGSDDAKGPQTAGSPVTGSQADRLAVARFNLYDLDRGLHTVTITIPQGADTFTLTGRVDFESGRGYGLLTNTATSPRGQLIAWTGKGVALQDSVQTSVPTTVTQQGWTPRVYNPQSSFDQVLEVVAALGVDRPFNSQLLRQNGATWKGTTTLDGTTVDLMAAEPDGPAQKVTYYVDAKGHLPRIDISLSSTGTAPARVDIGDDAGAPAVPVIKALQTKK